MYAIWLVNIDKIHAKLCIIVLKSRRASAKFRQETRPAFDEYGYNEQEEADRQQQKCQ